jgi:hypothetical protein
MGIPFASRNLFLVLSTALLIGCGEAVTRTDEGKPRQGSASPAAEHHADHDHDHDHEHHHAQHGPHNGQLIELGNEQYHAELIHTDKSITIYLLDSTATKAVPIPARELIVNLIHEGKPKQFELPAAAQAADPQGQSSRFVSDDAELAELVEDENNDARVVIEIDGRSYRGSLKHEHDDHAE